MAGMGLLLRELQIDRMQRYWLFMSAHVILMLTVLMSLDLLACDTVQASPQESLCSRRGHAAVVTGIQGLDDIVFLILLTLHQHRWVLYV